MNDEIHAGESNDYSLPLFLPLLESGTGENPDMSSGKEQELYMKEK